MDWLAMGGYAAYVWPVFIGAFLLVIGITITPTFRHRREINRLRNEQELAEQD